ncbi:MAG: ATP-binding protein [Chloroflexota bacterium]
MAPLMWLLMGFGTAIVLLLGGNWFWQNWQQRRYGESAVLNIALTDLSRQLINTSDKATILDLLQNEVAEAFGVAETAVFLTQGQHLTNVADPADQLPYHHAIVRLVAANGEAMGVKGRLQSYIEQSDGRFGWTAVWVPLQQGTELLGLWLLGNRAGNQQFSVEQQQRLSTLAQQAALTLHSLQFAQHEQQYGEQMQLLYHQAVAARELERGHLSRELHDGVLQDLCAISRDLKTAPQTTPLANRTDSLVDAIRAVCHNLRPPFALNNLITALHLLVEQANMQAEAPVSFETNIDTLQLPEETTLAVYRIVQESVNNALEHADPSEVSVRVTQYPDSLRVTISDDGIGLPQSDDLGHYVQAGHFGLAGMRERAKMIGGKLSLQTAQDYGTAVILELLAPES